MKWLIVFLFLTGKLICFTLNGPDLDEILQKQMTIIYPGTKWCGTGNKANNYNDLGTEIETDKCCRDHDYCDDYIRSNQTKYNLTNTASYTRVTCNCDKKFRDCLYVVNTQTSSNVGNIFFNLLKNKCFRKDYPAIGCIRFDSLLKKCLQYRYDYTKPKKYQWFDVPPF
ncbi:hypothetical protein FQR65_LT00462 [Abscondita terminalis]|nr:hypothetical protein FQR65_LT00462 [Abscondita terminalis]